MIAPTYTHPGVNRLLIELSQVERKARVARRDARLCRTPTRRIHLMMAGNYQAIADAILRKLGAA